jgi:TolA-binding protein
MGVALVLGVLLLPRRVPPEGVPLPVPDARVLAGLEAADVARAEHARAHPLPGAVRALGSAVRDFHTLEARGGAVYDARRAVDAALGEAVKGGTGGLLELRAVQLEGFLEEIRRFERTGEQSAELEALAGGFVRSMKADGWCEGHTLAADEHALRALFKQMWSTVLGLESSPDLALALDEQRAVYAFYLSHARPSKSMREALAAARRGARDDKACAAIDEAERAGIEAWRLERIGRLAALDPAYPADYARGIASYRRGDYGGAVQSLRAWLQAHPDGPLALRAQNYLRAAADAERVE